MKAKRFSSIANSNPPQFISTAQILGFGFAIGLALLTTFNGQHLVQRMTDSHANDAVSLAYLRIWIKAKPDAYPLRLVLARHELSQGNLQKAEAVLMPILHASDVDSADLIQAWLLMLKISKQEMWQQKPDTPLFAQAKQKYLQQLRTVSAFPWSRSQTQFFAQEASALGDLNLGYTLYTQLIKAHPCGNLSWYELVAKANLSKRRYQKAADTYFSASSCPKDPAQQRNYIVTGLKTLQSGGLLNDSMLSSEKYYDVLSADPKSLMYITKLALASGRPDLAEKYIARLLQQPIHTVTTGAR
jgi:tetratricopeptide (TPR) repeat protein